MKQIILLLTFVFPFEKENRKKKTHTFNLLMYQKEYSQTAS